MVFDFAAVKAHARKIVHDTFGVDAEYEASSSAVPVPLRVRWHNKMAVVGDPENAGYPVSLEGIDRIIFNTDELAEKGIIPARGGYVKITAPGFNGQVLSLEAREKKCGPQEEIWQVAPLTSNGN